MRSVTATALLSVLCAGAAVAQQRTSVSSYLQAGYQIINTTVGGTNLILIMKKDTSAVLCVVAIESGQTSGCQTIK
jgi:hypothetical protein